MSRGLRSLLLVLVVSIVGAVPSAIADADANSAIDAVRSGGASDAGDGSDQATPGSMVRGADTSAIDAGAARSDRHENRGGQLLAVAPGGVPAAVAAAFRQRVEPVTNARSGGPARACESRAPPVDPS